MGNLPEVIALIIRVLPLIIFDPIYLMILATLGFIIYSQYRRVYVLQRRMFGLNRGNPLKETFISLAYGVLGGIVASILFVFLGISLSTTGIAFVWLTALLLMIFSPRFLCFAYAGGLVSLLYLVFGFPKVSVTSIMGLVAILHLVEALLIFLNGHRNPMPLYVQNSEGKVVGGFSLQRFWPLPFITVLATVEMTSALESAIRMPDWWPLLQPEIFVPAGLALVFKLSPVFAGLGYSDVAISSLPEEKAAYSARNLFFYSIALLGLTLLADHYPYLEVIPVLFAPLGHEWVIRFGQQREKKRSSVFTYTNGVMVLDVYPNSPAAKMGLSTGDVILQINDIKIESPQHLVAEIGPWIIDPKLTVQNVIENTPPRVINFKGKIPPLGFIPAPQPNQPVYMVMRETWFNRMLKRLRQKIKG
ncbi:MAG: PDZ domain-containing protein [Firmicutes bacterium]|nr:PDZ domain-containing protein [Bacillota bacterium]